MQPVPVILNTASGTALAALEVLRSESRVQLFEEPPDAIPARVAEQLQKKVDRLIVVGGDGSLSSAAALVVDQPTSLAIIPGGTLNHFAQEHGIPTDAVDALAVALSGVPKPIDVGYVNDRLFLNTSSVGVYVAFVRRRQRWRRWLGYYLASALASLLTFLRLRTYDVAVEIDGQVKHYQSPLVFIGVDERALHPPQMGAKKKGGRRGLHLLIVCRTSRWSLIKMAVRALIRRIRFWGADQEMESIVVQECTITVRRSKGQVAVDGETINFKGSLTYKYRPEALTVIVPAEASADV